jgi:hypothetical protein
MPKTTSQLPAVSREASLAARALARLDAAAAKALGESEKLNGSAKSFQMVADAHSVTAVIKAPGLTVQWRDGSFAVDVTASTGD